MVQLLILGRLSQYLCIIIVKKALIEVVNISKLAKIMMVSCEDAAKLSIVWSEWCSSKGEQVPLVKLSHLKPLASRKESDRIFFCWIQLKILFFSRLILTGIRVISPVWFWSKLFRELTIVRLSPIRDRNRMDSSIIIGQENIQIHS